MHTLYIYIQEILFNIIALICCLLYMYKICVCEYRIPLYRYFLDKISNLLLFIIINIL